MAESSTSNTPQAPSLFGSQAETGQAAEVGTPSEQSRAPSPRDYAIGGGVLLVLVVAYFFARNAYATMLVGRRVEPRLANAAGWWLFIFLTLVSLGVVLAAIDPAMRTSVFVLGPLLLGALVALVLMLMSSRH